MAVLGSTVDPRLGAVNPAAIQALSQAGAATGQMYANLGRSIAGVVQDQAQRKTDAKIAEILDQSTIDEEDENGEPTGFKSLDQAKFRRLVSEKKVPPRLANSILQDTLNAWRTEADFRNAQQETAIRKAAQEADATYQEGTLNLGKETLAQEGKLARAGFNLQKEIANIEAETRKTISAGEIKGRLDVVNAEINAEKANLKTQLDAAKASEKREIRSNIRQLDKQLRQNNKFHKDKLAFQNKQEKRLKKKSKAEIGEIGGRAGLFEAQAEDVAVETAAKKADLAQIDPLLKNQQTIDVYTGGMSPAAIEAFESKTPEEKAKMLRAELEEAELAGDQATVKSIGDAYDLFRIQANREARILGLPIPNFRPSSSFLQSAESRSANGREFNPPNYTVPGLVQGALNYLSGGKLSGGK
tara:strand:+ start:195 stop:1439 length:1245 start_codon:yes stop_codon:yes gene_type:complete